MVKITLEDNSIIDVKGGALLALQNSGALIFANSLLNDLLLELG